MEEEKKEEIQAFICAPDFSISVLSDLLVCYKVKFLCELRVTCLFVFFLYFYFLLHPVDNTLLIQYQLIQSCLNYMYIIIIIIKKEN